MGKHLGKEIEHLFAKKRDAKLISETLDGNNLSFAKLIQLHENRVRSIGARFYWNESDIDDFCQNVFLKVYTNLRSFKGNSLFSTWLTRIAFTTAMNEKTKCSHLLALLLLAPHRRLKSLFVLLLHCSLSSFLIQLDSYF